MKKNSKAGRPTMYGDKKTVLYRALIRKDKEKEMRAEIKAVQDKYKNLQG